MGQLLRKVKVLGELFEGVEEFGSHQLLAMFNGVQLQGLARPACSFRPSLTAITSFSSATVSL